MSASRPAGFPGGEISGPPPEISDARIWSLVESAPDGIVLADELGLILMVNRQLETMFGYGREELVGRKVEQLLPDRYRQTHTAHRTGYRDEPRVRAMGAGLNLWAQRRDGSEFPVEISLSPLADGDGVAVVASVRDVSDRVAAEARTEQVRLAAERQVSESERAFRTAFDDAPVGMMLAHIDPAGARIVDRANVALSELLGRPEADLVGIDLAELTHPDDRAADVAAASEMHAGDRVRYVTEKRYLRADGSYVWVLLHSTVLGYEPGVQVLAHVLDISDRRAAEAERDRQQRWLAGLSDIRTHLLEDRPRSEALELVCRYAQELVGATWAAVASGAADAESLELVTEYGERPFAADVPLRVPPYVWAQLGVDAACASADHHWTPEFSGPSVWLPLIAAGEAETLLLLVVRGQDRQPFDDIEIRLVESFARQANAAFLRVRARRDQQRLFVMEDRERIARDLHDIVIQRMFAAGLGLEALVERVSPASAAEKIRATVDELDIAIRDLRSAIFGLSALDAPRLIEDRIGDTVAACSERLGFAVPWTVPEHIEAVPLAVVEQLIPALTEALMNVVRHADAAVVEVSVELSEHEVAFAVVDDGVGLGDELVHGKGLRNLAARAARVGGGCTIDDNELGGVTVRWWAPV